MTPNNERRYELDKEAAEIWHKIRTTRDRVELNRMAARLEEVKEALAACPEYSPMLFLCAFCHEVVEYASPPPNNPTCTGCRDLGYY